jgi:hypothetical protein
MVMKLVPLMTLVPLSPLKFPKLRRLPKLLAKIRE